MFFATKQALAAYFWENSTIKDLVVPIGPDEKELPQMPHMGLK